MADFMHEDQHQTSNFEAEELTQPTSSTLADNIRPDWVQS